MNSRLDYMVSCCFFPNVFKDFLIISLSLFYLGVAICMKYSRPLRAFLKAFIRAPIAKCNKEGLETTSVITGTLANGKLWVFKLHSKAALGGFSRDGKIAIGDAHSNSLSD